MLAKPSANAFAALLSAIAEPNRLRIIHTLRNGELSVSTIAQIVETEIVNVSHHLNVMKMNTILLAQKMGRTVLYSLNPVYFKQEDGKFYFVTEWCKMELL